MNQKTNKTNIIQEQLFHKKLKLSQLRDQFSINRHKERTEKIKDFKNKNSQTENQKSLKKM